ncbi:GNAT family N-acetyltransferase [Chloroflexota bacterium]
MIEILPVEDSHIPGILKLWEEFMDFHEDIDPRFPMRDDAQSSFKEHLKNKIDKKESHVLTAMDNGNLIGFGIAEISSYPPIFQRETYGIIDTMVVSADFRRKGIGEKILSSIFEWFESFNIHRIELSVAALNQVGYSFWRKHGFKDYVHRLYLDR